MFDIVLVVTPFQRFGLEVVNNLRSTVSRILCSSVHSNVVTFTLSCSKWRVNFSKAA